MNRTDRLYAIVEELRASAPRRRSARELSARFEVSVRTIERDIGALQEAGVPIYADVGRQGGYTLDKSLTLPPLNFTPAEAVAVAIALARSGDTPFGQASRGALQKIISAMSERDTAAARELATRVRLMLPAGVRIEPVSPVIERAILARRVLRIGYEDRHGQVTEREIEPVAVLSGQSVWYLIGWCRLRDAVRVFRLDRIKDAMLTDLPAVERTLEECACDVPDSVTLVSAF